MNDKPETGRAPQCTDSAPATKAHDAFWRYSLALWSQAAVQRELMQLQHSQQAPINLLLLAGFAACHGKRLEPYQTALQAALEPTQRLLRPLRQLRLQTRELAGTDMAYQALKEAELALERLEQQALVNALPENLLEMRPMPPATRRALIEDNLASCLAGLSQSSLQMCANLMQASLDYDQDASPEPDSLLGSQP